MLALISASILAADNRHIVASTPRCSAASSNSLSIEWDGDTSSDLFYVVSKTRFYNTPRKSLATAALV